MKFPLLPPKAWLAAGLFSVSVISVSSIPAARADEGMWLYNDPPKTQIK